MKKIINHPNDVVKEMLQGFAKVHPNLRYTEKMEVISRRNMGKKVGIISGGGAGHEPSFAGYVGKGMLDAAVSGNIFSSPGPDRILEGIHRADGGMGVLIILMNYSGDIMNFNMAKEIAEEEGIAVEIVVVHDDVAVPESTFSTGRRGIAGTLLVCKAAGAKAETGAGLQSVKQAAEKAAANVRSMGMAMSSCILPAVGTPGFVLGGDEIEIGMGIHGEPGIEKTTVKKASELAEILVSKILDDFDYSHSETALLVNGLGATPLMELYILYNDVERILTGSDIKVHRAFVGNYMTSLEMAGCSISMLKLDEEMKILMDAPCVTPAMFV